MAFVAASPAALGVASLVQAPRGAGAQPSSSRPTTVASVRWVPLHGGVSQRCSPPSRVRMVVSRQGFPLNGGEAEQQQQQQGGAAPEAAQSSRTAQQQQQREGPNDAGTSHDAPDQTQAQQQQRQWVGECGPCAPAFSADILSPWFPADRSLTEMLSTTDRLFGNMLLFGPGSVRRRQQQQQPQQPAGGLFSLAMRRPWDVQEDDKAYTLSFDLPGLSKEDVKVRVDENDILFISADKTTTTAATGAGEEGQQQQQESTSSSNLRAHATRKFQTQLKLPQHVQKDNISAEMKDGVLSITVPKIPPEELAGKGIDVNVA